VNIVIAAHHFPPDRIGGAELRVHRTAAWLRDRGHVVHVICVEDIEADREGGLVFHDDTYDGLPVRRLRFNLASAPDPFVWSYDNRWIGRHLRTYLHAFRPDVFHLVSGYLMSARTLRVADELGIPTVVSLTDFWFLCPRIHMRRSNGEVCYQLPEASRCARCLGEERRRYRIPGRLAPHVMDAFWRIRKGQAYRIEVRRTFLLETLDRVGRMISPSAFLRELFVAEGVDPARILFSRQGRDFPYLRPQDLIKPPSSYLRVGYVGAVDHHKGLHVLVDAMRRLPYPALRVHVYGDLSQSPRYAARLQKQARVDDRLRLEGSFAREDVSRVFRELDVLVVPSVWLENSPNVILEAFAHRVPAVVSNVGAWRNWFDTR